MLMRTDPFREPDRLTQQVLGNAGTLARPATMPMDAWQEGETFLVEFDLPGVDPESIDLDVERNVLTAKAERRPLGQDREVLAAERPRGVFSRQLILGRHARHRTDFGRLRRRGAQSSHPGGRAGEAAEDPGRTAAAGSAAADRRLTAGRCAVPIEQGTVAEHQASFLGLWLDEESLRDEFDEIIRSVWPSQDQPTRRRTAPFPGVLVRVPGRPWGTRSIAGPSMPGMRRPTFLVVHRPAPRRRGSGGRRSDARRSGSTQVAMDRHRKQWIDTGSSGSIQEAVDRHREQWIDTGR